MLVRSGLTIIKYWFSVSGDDKKRARLNVIRHFLSLIPFEDLTPEPIILPPRQPDSGYVRPPIADQTFVPDLLSAAWVP